VGETGGHLLRKPELHRPGLVLRVETFLREGVDEELGYPHRLGRGRSHRGQGFPREGVSLRGGLLQAGEDIPQVPTIALPEAEMPADLLRKRSNPLRKDFARAPPLFQEGGDPPEIRNALRLPEIVDESPDAAFRVPLGKTQTYRLSSVHGGGGKAVILGCREAHAPRQKPGGPVSGDETDFHLRDLDPRGRIGDHQVRGRGDAQAKTRAKTTNHADGRDAQVPDLVAQCLLVREKPIRQLSGGGIKAIAHHFDVIHARREILPTREDQRPNRVVSGDPVHKLDDAGGVRVPQAVSPVQGLDAQHRNAVFPYFQLHRSHPALLLPHAGFTVAEARWEGNRGSGSPPVSSLRECQ